MHHLQIEFKRDRSTVTNLPNLSPCRIGGFRSLSHSLLSPNPYLSQTDSNNKKMHCFTEAVECLLYSPVGNSIPLCK